MKRGALFLTLVVGLLVGLSRCGGDDPFSYVASSNKGDLATWTITGNDFSVVWKVTDNTGLIKKTLNASGTCTGEDANFKHRVCTVTTGSCTDGTEACGSDAPDAGDEFTMIEVPGVALMVKTPGDDQLHIGVLSGGCSSIAGDYSFVRTGLNQQGIFGMYRLGDTFTSVTHADFKFINGASMDLATDYSDPNGVATFTDPSCDAGIWTATTGGQTIRFTNTAAGMFLIDMPSGSGGIVSIKTSSAAALSDLANRTFYGVAFPDNAEPHLLNATTGSVTRDYVPLTAINSLVGGVSTPETPAANQGFYALTDFSGQTPAGPDFDLAPTGSSESYSSNALASTYPHTDDFPGLFWMKTADPAPPRGLMSVAMKYGSTVLIFGTVINDRSGNNELTGNYIVFSK